VTGRDARAIEPAVGEAVGKINGFNHIVLMCRDMDRSVRFYRDLLGLTVVRTAPERRGYERQYFFELANGEMFSLYQLSRTVPWPEQPVVNKLWPLCDGTPPAHPQKLDHLAFNVDTRKELLWFIAHLRANGVEVSEMVGDEPGTGFLAGRIYFHDPDGNPLEIATAELSNPGWREFDRGSWLCDDAPVPALRDGAAQASKEISHQQGKS
jgi:catechol 2,3-dioxygenase-like lactoylglutathione lyase family enzyme